MYEIFPAGTFPAGLYSGQAISCLLSVGSLLVGSHW